MSVFITTSDMPKNKFGEIIGKIYNARRRDSHKRLRLCWRNLLERSVNDYKDIEMWSEILQGSYKGPYPVDWKY